MLAMWTAGRYDLRWALGEGSVFEAAPVTIRSTSQTKRTRLWGGKGHNEAYETDRCYIVRVEEDNT